MSEKKSVQLNLKDTPINFDIVKSEIEKSGISNIGRASIREIRRLIDHIEHRTGKNFIRMEMGIPGLPACEIGVNAEIEALKNKGIASMYVDIDGIPELKQETARFCRLFMDIDISPGNCIPTVGSMQGGLASFITTSRMYKDRATTLFIDPCFPVHKQQHHVMDIKYERFDIYEYRGEKLRDKLESHLRKGNISSVIYSNPNNPSWICFTEVELKIIGELANKYNVIIMEDLAYFGMDFRNDISRPGVPPFQPTVAKYTDNFILFISSSKAFSYAGQRIGMMVISDKLFNTKAPDLKRYYTTDHFGNAMVFGTMYALTAGTAHSSQYALAAIFKAVNDGKYNFVEVVKEYGQKANIMKKYFTENGFRIVYDRDNGVPVADGFYFTVSYPGFSGEQLVEELLYYGISAISLSITGSDRTEGLRACVSLVNRNQFPELESRLRKFCENHPV
jgi:aspartate/methionine/tyrosine aminotransferase